MSLVKDLYFIQNGKYVGGHVDSSQDLIQLLESYRSITGTAFTNSQNLVQAIKNIDENTLQMRFISPASRPRLFWQMNAGEPTIPYDGVPFMSVGHGTDLPCIRFGGRRKKIEQVTLPSGEVVPVDYRMKTGCEAKITIRRILRYPCAEYSESIIQGIAAVRRHRKQILEDLVQRIIGGSAKFQERYHFLLPTPMVHNGHNIADIEAPPPIAQQVLDEIITHLNSGVTSVSGLREHIKNFVMTKSNNPVLHANDSMYYPSEFDIFRQMYWLYKMGQVGEQDGTFKSSISLLSGIERALTQSVNQSPNIVSVTIDSTSPTPITTTSSSDALTNAYSMIMDDTTNTDSTNPLELRDHQISAEQEVELDAGGDNSTHLRVIDSSPMVSQIQVGMNSGSPISIPPGTQVEQISTGKRSSLQLLQSSSVLAPVKVAASKPITTSISSHANNYRSTPMREETPGSTQEVGVVVFSSEDCSGM